MSTLGRPDVKPEDPPIDPFSELQLVKVLQPYKTVTSQKPGVETHEPVGDILHAHRIPCSTQLMKCSVRMFEIFVFKNVQIPFNICEYEIIPWADSYGSKIYLVVVVVVVKKVKCRQKRFLCLGKGGF